MSRLASLARATQCTPATLAVVAFVIVVNVVLVNWSQPIFGAYWKHVMWEGGLIEDLTVVHFLLGAVVFALCAASRRHSIAHRRWFVLYALADLVLVGEETNYGRGTLFLDLADPDFAKHYNPQSGNLHNVAPPIVPIIGFFVILAILRIGYRPIVTRLRLPLARGFLNAVLLTLIAAPFMPLHDDRFLSIDEVFEWSGSLFLLCLALHFYRGWCFRPRVTDP